MNWHLLGEISLNISTLIYFIWFIPQLRLTFKRRSTEGLSLWMHSLLFTGYLADLLYGFGTHLPLQYRLVTISGLCYLLIEHFQFWRFGLKTQNARITYIGFSFIFLISLVYAIFAIAIHKESVFFYNMAGMVANACWISFFMPQILKNFRNEKTEGLSFSFVFLSLLTTVCDITSTYALNYNWPSKLGAPTTLAIKLFIVLQCLYYSYKSKREHICPSKLMPIG